MKYIYRLKNIFKAANTPITIFIMWSVLYIFSQVNLVFSSFQCLIV